MTLVARAFDLLLKYEWGNDNRCPDCYGLASAGHYADCELGKVVEEIKALRQTDKPVLKQGIEKVRYVNSRPSDRGCTHSAQSWYIKDSFMGCHDCDDRHPKT